MEYSELVSAHVVQVLTAQHGGVLDALFVGLPPLAVSARSAPVRGRPAQSQPISR